FLGVFSFLFCSSGGVVGFRIYEWSVQEFKWRVRAITCRSRGVRFGRLLLGLSRFAGGWVNYFGLTTMNSCVVVLSGWICRRLWVYLWRQWKCSKVRFVVLVGFGVSMDVAWWAISRKGCWRVAGSQILSFSLTNKVLAGLGYDDILVRYRKLCLSR
ncbi:MAG: group II intron reverse transcriptase/maturase, partial [Candidatus Bathyarchaeota archaeon]|nr:group II intron reverse transcriptase/maturase [Candidatus Termiticorpusculum sp.]